MSISRTRYREVVAKCLHDLDLPNGDEIRRIADHGWDENTWKEKFFALLPKHNDAKAACARLRDEKRLLKTKLRKNEQERIRLERELKDAHNNN